MVQTHIVVALDSIDEGLISHDLSFSIEECLESLFDCLQVLLTDLRKREFITVNESHGQHIFLSLRQEQNYGGVM